MIVVIQTKKQATIQVLLDILRDIRDNNLYQELQDRRMSLQPKLEKRK